MRVSSTKAVGVVGLPPDDEGRLSVGLRALVGLMQLALDSPYHAVPIVFALLTSYVDKRRLVTWEEIVTFHRTWRRSPKEQAELEDLEDREWFDRFDLNGVHGALGLMADTGLFIESDNGVALSDAGDVFVTAWLRFMEGD